MIKVTKAEIIGKAIEYLKDSQSKNQKLEREFENESKKLIFNGLLLYIFNTILYR